MLASKPKIQSKPEISASKMDVPTLTATLTGFRNFLEETYVRPRYGDTKKTVPSGADIKSMSTEDLLKAIK